MKVILTEEVRGLGGRGDVVQVKEGYARNFLLPKKFAKVATPGNIKVVEQQRKKWAELAESEKAAAKEMAAKIEGVKIAIHKRVGETGTLYGSVTSHEIADALHAQGYEVDKRRIELDHPIKTIGSHELEVKLHRDVAAKIEVEVLPEAEAEA